MLETGAEQGMSGKGSGYSGRLSHASQHMAGKPEQLSNTQHPPQWLLQSCVDSMS